LLTIDHIGDVDSGPAFAITLLLPQAQSEGPKKAARATASADVHRTRGRFDEAIA
jgi:hypothetical protein